MIYTVTFNPALDYVVFLEDLVPGDINRSIRESIFYGGKGINVSGILKMLGQETTALGFVAGFTGKALEEGVESLGLKADFIRLPEGNTRINVKVKHGDETEINGQGPVITGEALEALFARLDQLEQEDILVLAGSIPNTLPEDVYERILARLEPKGIRVVVDATKDLLLNVLKYHPFLIKPNNHELGEMFGNMQYCYLWYRPHKDKPIFAAIGDGGNVIYADPEKSISVGVTGTFKPRIFDRVDFIEKNVIPLIEGA